MADQYRSIRINNVSIRINRTFTFVYWSVITDQWDPYLLLLVCIDPYRSVIDLYWSALICIDRPPNLQRSNDPLLILFVLLILLICQALGLTLPITLLWTVCELYKNRQNSEVSKRDDGTVLTVNIFRLIEVDWWLIEVNKSWSMINQNLQVSIHIKIDQCKLLTLGGVDQSLINFD